jgi:hypothetical protein
MSLSYIPRSGGAGQDKRLEIPAPGDSGEASLHCAMARLATTCVLVDWAAARVRGNE